MQIFEFYFNPKARENTICDSFVFEPENVQENRLGSLYMVGELNNSLPQNAKLLENLALVIKKEYYLQEPQKTCEQCLREGLRKANEFLNQETKKGNVSWLGNLSFAILGLDDFILNFAKVGSLKILLKRGSELLDIGQNLESQDVEPYPLKLFGNIAIGKLSSGDRLMMASQGVATCFEKFNVLKDVLEIQKEKEVKKILKKEGNIFKKLSGICLLIDPGGLVQKKYGGINFGFSGIKTRISSLGIIVSLLLAPFKIIAALLKTIFGFLPQPVKKLWFFTNPVFNFISDKTNKRALLAVFFLAILLTAGFYIFKDKGKEEQKLARLSLDEIKSKAIWAESVLISKDQDQANILFQEAWNMVIPLTQNNSPLKDEAILLKNSIEKNLNSLNKLETIEKAEPIFTFKPGGTNTIPQKFFIAGSGLNFFSPLSGGVYKLLPGEKTLAVLETNAIPVFGINFQDSPLLFAKPNILFSSDGKFISATLQAPEENFVFGNMAGFGANLYFLDNSKGEIIKYSLPRFKNGETLIGKKWLSQNSKKIPADAIDGEAMALDGSVWILTKENKIERYYDGIYKETFSPNLFPYLENPIKILTSQSNPYLYILEPSKKRIIVLTKHNEIVQQYQGEIFDNLLDFAVSPDGKTIYLLNGKEVYQISTMDY